MTGFFDMDNDEFEKLSGGFWDMDFGNAPAGRRDPLLASSMDEATDIMAANAQDWFRRNPTATSVVGVAGKALQPFAAPQQILFAGLRAGVDLFDGEDETDAWETMKRGGRSALAYLTYQHGRDLPGFLKNKDAPDPTIRPITGYELFKDLGAPKWVARWGGTAADFLLDVPLVGAVAKASKVEKLTAGLRLGENLAQSFDSPAAYRAFAGGVLAAPFTTHPIKTAAEAVPVGLRQAGRERLIDPILNLRHVPKSTAGDAPVSPTLGQYLFSRDLGVPEEVVAIQQRRAGLAGQYTVLHNETAQKLEQVMKGLEIADQEELGALMGRLADESSEGKRAGIEGQIRALETRTGQVGLFDRAIQATNRGVQFDVFGAEKMLHSSDLMSEDALRKYQSGDKRHLRRVFVMNGEDGGSQIRRLMERDAPADVIFDRPGLSRLYGETLNPTLPPAPPVRDFAKSTPTRVSQFPGRTALVDPVADAERLVWREVPREVEVGTYDLGDLDLGNLGPSEITSVRNILGWDAVKRNPQTGKWEARGVVDNFPVGHPVIQGIFGDLKDRGVSNIRVEPRTFREQVPNHYDPRQGVTPEMQRAMMEEELTPQQGALYVHTRDLTGFMAGATARELAAFERASERFPIRSQTRTVGKNEVEDTWFPVDPTDPDLTRLVERARGGGAALFDGATGQPALTAALPDKTSPKLPSPDEFAEAVERAYTNPDTHPVDFLRGFFTERGMNENHIARVLENIGADSMRKFGIEWRPSDNAVVRHFTRKKAGEASGPGDGGRGTAAVTTQREEISEWYADVLGEIEDFGQRLAEQHRVVSKAATRNGTVRDIRKYLLDNDLIETVDNADMGAIHKTAGLRVVNADLARKLGNEFKEGEVIPAEIHRILHETVTSRDTPTAVAAWQWMSSRWQGVKLANPGSISTNLRSTFVMAHQNGHNPLELLRGMGDFLRLHALAVTGKDRVGAMDMLGVSPAARAKQGDGALDINARVNGVTMRELFENGAFIHNTLMNAEVVQQSSRLMDELSNAGGNNLQRGVAAIQEWLTETAGGQRAAGAYRTAVTPMRWLGDMYGRVDSLAKGGLYMTLRRKGMDPAKAASIADETFFNYNNVPYVVDAIRKLGLIGMPFVSFKFLATGRFFKALYHRPYTVDAYYRLPNSSRAALADEEGEEGNDTSALAEYDAASPDYIRKGLYIPLGKDSGGRVRAVRLDDVLPETAVFDAWNADGVMGTIPPAVQLVSQISSGKGYQGREVYRGGGGTYLDTRRDDPTEAARGLVKSLWQFGAYPWAPGQPQTERLVKALVARSVPADTLADPRTQAALKVLTEGPAAYWDKAPLNPNVKGKQPQPDTIDAVARIFGIKAYPVDPNPGRPGTAYYNKVDLEQRIQTLDKRMNEEMRAALSDEQRAEIRARYAGLREPLLRRLRGQE